MASRIPFRFAPVPHDMLFEHGVPPQVVVLWAAVYRLNDLAGGAAAIGQVELGEKLGWSDDTVARWARKGHELGWLAIRKRGQGLPNVYEALTPEPAELRLQESAVRAPKPPPPPAELRDQASLSREKHLESLAPQERRADNGSIAAAILREAWEAQEPRPQQPFIGAQQVIKKALNDGWSPDDLAAFFRDEGFPVTGARLDIWRNRRKPGRPVAARADGWDRDGPEGVVKL